MPDLPDLSKFFPTDRAEPCYAIYAPVIDRFLMVDRHDLSILLRAATLFSSKIITAVCVYDTKVNPPLTNATCLAWAPVHRVSLSRSRFPTVLPLEGPDAIVEKGPLTYPDAEVMLRAQRYLMFTVSVIYAQFMANASTGQADIRLLRQMLPKLETLPGASLSSVPQLFQGQARDQRIEEIVYYSDSVEQARAEIDALLLTARADGKPGAPASRYHAVFQRFLGGQPALSA